MNKTDKTLAPLEPTVCLEEAGPQKYIISYNKYRKIRGDDKYNEHDAMKCLAAWLECSKCSANIQGGFQRSLSGGRTVSIMK